MHFLSKRASIYRESGEEENVALKGGTLRFLIFSSLCPSSCSAFSMFSSLSAS